MPKCLSKAYACAAMSLWVGISAITLLITSVIYLKPVMQVIRYAKTSCRVESSHYSTQYICQCAGYGCQSIYPCYLVLVSFNHSTPPDDPLLVQLFRDDVQKRYAEESSGTHIETCSLKICNEEESENRAAVLQFQQYIDSSGPYIDCLYDPWFPSSGAILQRVRPHSHVFHAVFWPFLSCLLGILACSLFCRWCRRKEDLIPKKLDKVRRKSTSHESKSLNSQEAKSLTQVDVDGNSVEVCELERRDTVPSVHNTGRCKKKKSAKHSQNSIEVVELEPPSYRNKQQPRGSSDNNIVNTRPKHCNHALNSIGTVQLEPRSTAAATATRLVTPTSTATTTATCTSWPRRKPVPNSIEIIDLSSDRIEEGKGSRTRRKPLLSL